ncbi:MAG: putative lipid II flippase FtsW [Acidobacteria bacterium]|nr:putative lipid II flippase FtsW [Acidobacteriota bacterium]
MSRKLTYDRTLFGAALMILLIGLAMIYSASAIIAAQKTGISSPYHFFLRQCVFLAIGSFVMFAAMHLDLAKLRDWKFVLLTMTITVGALVAVLFQPAINGSRRWFSLGAFQAQPAEVAKLAVVIFLATQLAKREDRINELGSTLLPLAGILAIPLGLILLEPDFGTAAVLGTVVMTMLFVAGVTWRKILLFSLGGIPLVTALVLGAEYRRSRIMAFLHPESDPFGSGFQVMQSLIAFGTGGLTGVGIGSGRQKLFYLPEPHTDFIFAIVGEELGFIGSVILILLFAVVVWRGARIAWSSSDAFIRYAAVGLTVMIAVQALVNMSVALALLPTKGIPLPLVSYGGSSLIVTMAAAGLLLNMSQHTGRV